MDEVVSGQDTQGRMPLSAECTQIRTLAEQLRPEGTHR